jgi:dolichyl-phosphate-mannose--protein O-mannosyl transferase
VPIATLDETRRVESSPIQVREVPAALSTWRPASSLQSWLWTLLVALLAAVTRFWSLGFPTSKSFDEIYYATEAQELLRYGYEDNRDYMFIVHPPLGKWCIALTSWIFGPSRPGGRLLHSLGVNVTDSLSWRIAPAIAGVVSVVILTRLTQRMLRSVVLGALAGTLLSLDGISLVMSRVALLDIFLQVFILAGFAALVLDRDQVRARLGTLYAAGVDMRLGAPSLGPRPWRLAGGVLLGLACGVKWSALSFWIGFSLLSLVWDRGALKAAGVDAPWFNAMRRSWPGGFGSLGLSAVGAYLLCWTGWFVGENSWNRHWADTHPAHGLARLIPGSLRSLLNYHADAYEFHSHLYDPHAYKANPWSWLVLGRPISFYYPSEPTGCGASSCAREILLIGTPLLYWAILPALGWLAWHWITTRDWRAGAIGMAFLVGWCVWLHDIRRTAFLFYMTPLMPFLMLAVTMAVAAMLARAPDEPGPLTDAAGPEAGETDGGDGVRVVGLREWFEIRGMSNARLLRTIAVTVWLGAVVADFIWMWPLSTGGLLTHAQWQSRMWFPSWI